MASRIPASAQILPRVIALTNGVHAQIALDPPSPVNPLRTGGAPRADRSYRPNIYVRLSRGGKVLCEESWDCVVRSARVPAAKGAPVLAESDIDVLDDKGWGVMETYGLVPSAFAA